MSLRKSQPWLQWVLVGTALLIALVGVNGISTSSFSAGAGLALAGLFAACLIAAGIVGSRWWFVVLLAIFLGLVGLFLFAFRKGCCMM